MGSCQACLQACPTQAICGPVPAGCAALHLVPTIEHNGPIPRVQGAAIGNRIYGCDDCQLVCPWNKFARPQCLPDFDERAGLNGQQLALLLGWSEAGVFYAEPGQPHRRIGHERWLRNCALAAAMRCGRCSGLSAGSADIQVRRLKPLIARITATG